MPVVSDIKAQRKDNGLYNIYIDGNYSFSLGQDKIDFYSLYVDKLLSKDELLDIKKDSEQSKALAISMNYLAIRMRSEKEVRDYLEIRKGFDQIIVDHAISRLIELNYLNDQNFADMWVDNRLKLNLKSTKEISQELLSKGISKEIISSSMGKINEDQKREVLLKIINKKFRQSKYQDREKIIKFLLGKGFYYSDINHCIDESGLFD